MKKLFILEAIIILLFGMSCSDDDSSPDCACPVCGYEAGSAGMDAGAAGTGGESGTGGSSGAAGNEPMDAGQDGGVPPPTLADLQGTWLGPCFEDAGEGDFRRAFLEFENNRATMTLGFYGENNPTCENVLFTIFMEIEISIGGEVPGQPGVYWLNVQITGVKATMNNANAVTYANSEGLFGFTDWELDVAKDVAGREFAASDADAGTGEVLPEVGSQTVMYFWLNPTKDRLRISDMSSGGGLSSEEYVKQ